MCVCGFYLRQIEQVGTADNDGQQAGNTGRVPIFFARSEKDRG